MKGVRSGHWGKQNNVWICEEFWVRRPTDGRPTDRRRQVTMDAVVAMPCPWCMWSLFDGGAQVGMACITMASPCDHLGDPAVARRWWVRGMRDWGGPRWLGANVVLDAPATTSTSMAVLGTYHGVAYTSLARHGRHTCCLRKGVVGGDHSCRWCNGCRPCHNVAFFCNVTKPCSKIWHF